MASDITITMLGASGSGKTCYMLGMYAKMQIGLKGLTISSIDADDDLRLTALWEKLVELQDEKRWPPPNDREAIQYAFSFNYGFRPLMSFDWLDYRGGAMHDLSSEEDVQALINQLAASSCIFLCVSGEHLQEPLANDEEQLNLIARKARVDRMNRFMRDVAERVKPTSSRPFPVAIAITQYDRCSTRDRDAVIADVKELFPSLFTSSSGWLTMICPVSLGKTLANDPNNGQINPVNIHLPVVFAIWAKFREYGLDSRAELDGAQSRIQSLQEGNFLTRWFNSGEVAQQQARLAELQAKLGEIETNMTLVVQDLRKASLYLDGKEQDVGI